MIKNLRVKKDILKEISAEVCNVPIHTFNNLSASEIESKARYLIQKYGTAFKSNEDARINKDRWEKWTVQYMGRIYPLCSYYIRTYEDVINMSDYSTNKWYIHHLRNRTHKIL